MSSKKIIAVVGATGAQGGSLVQPFLEGGWHVRALTRDANSEKAKALAAKGAEVVTANSNNKDSLKAAFKGAYAVFAVTNFWDPEIYPNNLPKEQEQGRLMADAASESGVTYYMWSTLHNTEAISKGKWKVPHFTGKSKVDEHIKAKSNLKPIFLLPGFYATNLAGMSKVTDDTVQFTLALKPDTKLPVTDISDTGKIAFKVMQDPEKYVGKYIHVAGEYLTGGEIASIYSKVTGQKAEFVPIPLDNLKQNHEFYEMFGWFQESGYYNNEDISDTKKIYPQATTFEQFLKKSGFRITGNPRL